MRSQSVYPRDTNVNTTNVFWDVAGYTLVDITLQNFPRENTRKTLGKLDTTQDGEYPHFDYNTLPIHQDIAKIKLESFPW